MAIPFCPGIAQSSFLIRFEAENELHPLWQQNDKNSHSSFPTHRTELIPGPVRRRDGAASLGSKIIAIFICTFSSRARIELISAYFKAEIELHLLVARNENDAKAFPQSIGVELILSPFRRRNKEGMQWQQETKMIPKLFPMASPVAHSRPVSKPR